MKWFFYVLFCPSLLWAQNLEVPHEKVHREEVGAIENWQNGKDDLKISLPVTKFKLANGLTVLLLEDHTVPIISYHTWYKVGSSDEAEGVTGAAHMLEHMMFKGAKKYSGKQFDQLMNENGVHHNAFTTFDYTGFYENLPASKLELIMDVELDRMSSLALNPEDLLSERDVVKEERRWRVDNNPHGLLFEATMANVFHVHPYRWPVIGTMNDISNYNVETLRKFYSTYYVPNNAVLVIAGDFKTSAVKKLVEKYYGRLPYKEVPARSHPVESPQKVQYNAFVRQDVQNISVDVAFQGVPQGHNDMYALDLASYILGAGTSSRLHKRLVYQGQMATSAEAYHFSLKDEGLFNVGFSLKPGEDSQKALELVYNELFKLRTQKVSDAELKKAKTLAMKSFVDGLVTIDEKARALAAAEKYNKVTADEIKNICAKMLNTNQRSIVVLQPKTKAAL
jgi:zinc protease